MEEAFVVPPPQIFPHIAKLGPKKTIAKKTNLAKNERLRFFCESVVMSAAANKEKYKDKKKNLPNLHFTDLDKWATTENHILCYALPLVHFLNENSFRIDSVGMFDDQCRIKTISGVTKVNKIQRLMESNNTIFDGHSNSDVLDNLRAKYSKTWWKVPKGDFQVIKDLWNKKPEGDWDKVEVWAHCVGWTESNFKVKAGDYKARWIQKPASTDLTVPPSSSSKKDTTMFALVPRFIYTLKQTTLASIPPPPVVIEIPLEGEEVDKKDEDEVLMNVLPDHDQKEACIIVPLE
jgi:hypothetical protein